MAPQWTAFGDLVLDKRVLLGRGSGLLECRNGTNLEAADGADAIARGSAVADAGDVGTENRAEVLVLGELVEHGLGVGFELVSDVDSLGGGHRLGY